MLILSSPLYIQGVLDLYAPTPQDQVLQEYSGLPFGPLTTVDLYNPTWQMQYPQVIDGLMPRGHAVAIRVLGAHSGGSSGNLVVFGGYSVP